MRRLLFPGIGIVCYLVFLGVFLYTIGFVENLLVPKSIDSPPDETSAWALSVDLLFLGLFAVPHSIMARQGFKRWWTRIIPQALERSIYVLITSLLLMLLFWQWRAMLGVVWEVTFPIGRWVLDGICGLGWLIVFLSTFMVDHFDLFGLRQIYLYATNRPYEPIGMKVRGFNRLVRHPLMLGFLIAFWATPRMTVGHLVFALVMTTYIFIAMPIEERDLVGFYGNEYEEYRRRVRMLLPFPK